MAVLSLKVRIEDRGVVKTMQFDPATLVYDACKIIREKMPEANLGQHKEYGLFLADEDPKKGVWMESGRSLEYYLVRSGDLLEYKKKTRTLRVRMLDGAVKTLLLDDSQPVGQLMVVVCTRIGITNHEEYSLVREGPVERDERATSTLRREESKGVVGTLTLGRNKEKKMDALRKALHTDEELNWVEHSKTLREQGIEEAETLLLRRKYFFSDQNVDSRDPVQLNLLYVQCRDGVIDGSHPVSREEAFFLAALQCQIQFGDHVESKHKYGFLDLREFLPKEYTKTRDAEKRVLAEYRALAQMNELDAKVRYVHKCRSLKTYGVTFFLVKEKMKGKNKLVPRLLGINKDCVMRVDEKTKEVMKVWPLEQVRRWAASPNTFTLDFGDYQDAYYSVQTLDGEKIAQLIAGYIDIILKKKRAKDHFGIEGDEGSTMLEDTVAPAKATLMSHGHISAGDHGLEGSVAVPGLMRHANGEMPYGMGSMTGAQYGAVEGQVISAHPPPGQQPKVFDTASKSQRALVGTIEASVRAVERAEAELDTAPQLPPLHKVSEKWKQDTLNVHKATVEDQLAAMGAATAHVVQLTAPADDKIDHTAVGAAINTISSNLPDMTKGVKTVAALMPEEDRSDDLLQATRKLCGSFSDFLNAVNPDHQETRQTVLAAAGRVGDYSHAMKQTMEDPSDESKEFQDRLVQLAKAVATSTAQLVLKAKNVSSACEDQALQDRVIHSATQCAFATSQLVACARVVAPTIDSPACQQQLIDAAKQVARAVDQLLQDAEAACTDQRSLGDLRAAAAAVTKALNDLLLHIKTGPHKPHAQDQELETIITSTDRLISYSGSANEMVRQAKVLAEATTHLVSHIKGEAETTDSGGDRDRLLGAARRLADATSKMINATKTAATDPAAPEHQIALRTAAEDLRSATSVAAGDQLRRKALANLEMAARQTATQATQVIQAANNSGPSNSSQESHQLLKRECMSTAELLPRVISTVSKCQAEPENSMYHSELTIVCRDLLEPCGRLVSTGRSAVPSVGDQSSAMHLSQTTVHLSESVSLLRTALTRFQISAGSAMDLGNAVEVANGLKAELIEFERSAGEGRLYPVPGETTERSTAQLTNSTKSVGSSMAQLLSASVQGDEEYVGMCARDATEGLRQLTGGIHGVCSTRRDAPTAQLFHSGQDVMSNSASLFIEVQSCMKQPAHPENQERLARVARQVTKSLNSCLSCLPGQQDIDAALLSIKTLISEVNSSQVPVSSRSAEAVQEDLVRLASQLSEATSRLAGSVGAEPHVLGDAINHYVTCFRAFFTCGLEMTHHQADPGTRAEMIEGLRAVAMESVRLLDWVKTSVADPSAPNLRQATNASAKSVTEAINRLIDICVSGAAWQAECEKAIRRIQSMRHLMEPGPTEPINDLSYYACLEVVTEKSKHLGEGMTGIAQHAKQGHTDRFGSSVADVAEAVCGLAESAGQAAYLVAVSDPASVPGRAGLIDANRLGRNIHLAREACNRLSSASYTQHQVLEDATAVAKHTSDLTNMCKDASSRTPNAAAKRHFVNCARDVASNTANLIKTIKALDSDFSDSRKTECSRAANSLSNALDSLSSFVSSPEFASLPAKISSAGREAQRPITAAGSRMLDGSCDMIRTAKVLALNPRDPPTWQTLASHSKTVSDSIKALVSGIRDRAPGQAECDAAIERLGALINRIDQASLAAMNQNLAPSGNANEAAALEAITTSGLHIQERLPNFQLAAKAEAENLGHRVRDTMGGVEALVDGCVGAASHSHNSHQQMALMSQTKTVAEAALQAVYAAKDAGGNPKAREFHPAVDEAVAGMRESVGELLQSVQTAVSEAGIVSTMVESISRAIARTDAGDSQGGDQGRREFVDCQTRMVRCCREISRIGGEMVSKSYSEPGSLGPLALELSRNYAELAEESREATAATAGTEVSQRIRSSVQELGQACIGIVKSAGACRAAPGDDYAKKELAESSRIVNEKVSLVLSALQAGSRGTQACINAASTVSGIIGDLDTTIMFATAGTLNPDTPSDHFSDHREGILKTAKALVEDTKALVSGAASSQEQLAVAAQNAVRTIVQLSDVVKSGAAALTSNSSEAQVLVIHAVKDVAAALASLIHATKNASGKSFNDPAMSHLKDAAKVMVTNVTSLLKTVKTVEDEEQRGTRALEAAVEAIAQEIRAFDGSEPPLGPGKPEDLLRVSKPLTDATGRAMAAAQSLQQDDVIAAANLARKVVSDMLSVTKCAAYSAESPEHRYKAMDAARDVAIKVRELLQALLAQILRSGPGGRDALVPASRAIAMAVTELVSYAEILKGENWEDPTDPTVLAESELLGAANSIEAAARKLAALRPRVNHALDASEELNFDEQILEAAKSIATAVQLLVKAASAAQRELVAQGRLDPTPSWATEDFQWSEGLVSAARMVAAAVHSLCEAANALVQGHATEEKLISAAKQVASSTAQLLVACKVKADINSRAMQRLQAAGSAVKTATEHLVRAAKASIEAEDERTLVISSRMVGGIAQVMDAQEAVLRKEKELEEARVKLAAIRKAKYEANPPGSHSPSPDLHDPQPQPPYYSDF